MLTRRIVAWDAHVAMRQLQRGTCSSIANSHATHAMAAVTLRLPLTARRAPQQTAAATSPFNMRSASVRRMHPLPPGASVETGSSAPQSRDSTGPKTLPQDAARLLAEAAAKLLAEEGGNGGKKQGQGAARSARTSSPTSAAGRTKPTSSSPASSTRSSNASSSSSGGSGKLSTSGRPSSSPSSTSANRSKPSSSSASGASRGASPKGKATTPGPEDAQRLAKVLAGAGVASRRACEALIEAGKVKVNGVVVQQQGTTVRPDKDIVTVNGKRIVLEQPQQYYFMVNKPKGYICSNVDTVEGRGKRAVDVLKPWLDEWASRQKDKKVLPPRLFTVGRLDVASHGMILVTNDGHWAQKVIHPSAEITKEYVVRVDKVVPQSGLEAILKGTEVEGSFVAPVEVSTLESKDKLRIVVKEGKKHEVRELVASAGFEVQSLKRVRIGGLRMPSDMGLGTFKQLSGREIKAVTDMAQQETLRRNAWASATKLLVRQ